MKMRTEEANPKDYQIKVNLWVDFIEIFSIFASEIWKMYTFDKIRDGVYAVRYPDEEDNVLDKLLDRWNDAFYLRQFFRNKNKIKTYFEIDDVNIAVQDTIEDAAYLEDIILNGEQDDLDDMFQPLSHEDSMLVSCSRRKARNWEREDHDSWLRIYAIKLDPGVYVITGGAIKLARKMQDAVATSSELQRLNDLKQYFVDNGALVL